MNAIQINSLVRCDKRLHARSSELVSQASDLVVLALPILREELNLPSWLTVEFCRLQEKELARYWGSDSRIEIDVERLLDGADFDDADSLMKFMSVFSHECVHADQLVDGRLMYGGGTFLWNGNVVDRAVKYYDLPWEVEARRRQTGLARKVLRGIF